jgi:hypothetical protein
MKKVKSIRFIEDPKVMDAIDMNSILGGGSTPTCSYLCSPYGGTIADK